VRQNETVKHVYGVIDLNVKYHYSEKYNIDDALLKIENTFEFCIIALEF